MSRPDAVIAALEADVARIEQDASLREESSFAHRAEAIDHLEEIASLCCSETGIARRPGILPGNATRGTQRPGQHAWATRCSQFLRNWTPTSGMGFSQRRCERLAALRERGAAVQACLEAIDDALFQRLRAEIRSGACRGAELRRCIARHAGEGELSGQDDPRYDSVDALINRLFLGNDLPQETIARDAEMVAYQPAPARTILQMLDGDGAGESDVFYDLGSGLGRVAMLVSLASGARAKGVEVDPAICTYAARCAAELNLSRVEFINADARTADYSDGTVFFMYTPFGGSMLRQVLERLRQEAAQRPIRLYTYGPCTLDVSQQGWLERLDEGGDHVYRLGVFRSKEDVP